MSRGKWTSTLTFDIQERITEAMADKLNVSGSVISTRDVMDRITDLPYHILVKHTKMVMDTMIELGKAKKIQKGQWQVLRPNERIINDTKGAI